MTGGDAEATVGVVAPSSGGTRASYTVSDSDSTDHPRGGQTCTVTGASGSCTLTGLTNGDEYTVVSTATNEGCTSASSVASSAFVPLAPAGPARVRVLAGRRGRRGLCLR